MNLPVLHTNSDVPGYPAVMTTKPTKLRISAHHHHRKTKIMHKNENDFTIKIKLTYDRSFQVVPVPGNPGLNKVNQQDVFGMEITGAGPGRHPTPKGGGGGTPPPLRTPKLSHRTVCFVGAGGAADFVFGIRRGGIFLFHPMCLYSKYSQFCGEFKNG